MSYGPLGLMSTDLEKQRNPNVVFRPFDEGGPSRRIGLAWRKSSARKAEFEALGETIRAAYLAG